MAEANGEGTAGPVAPQPPLISNYGLALAVYVLYLVGFFTGITVFVGVIIAYLQRGKTDRVCESHIEFQIRTFWIGLLYLFVGLLTLHFGVGILVLIWWAVWALIRCVKGLLVLNNGQPITDPKSWWFGER
jgi:uncharacterized membrane protein